MDVPRSGRLRAGFLKAGFPGGERGVNAGMRRGRVGAATGPGVLLVPAEQAMQHGGCRSRIRRVVLVGVPEHERGNEPDGDCIAHLVTMRHLRYGAVAAISTN